MDTARLRFERLPLITMVSRLLLIALLSWATFALLGGSIAANGVVGAAITGSVALWLVWDTARGLALVPGLVVRVDGARIEVRAPVMGGALVSGDFGPGATMVLVGGPWGLGRRQRIGYQLRQGAAVARFLGPAYLSGRSVARLREVLALSGTELVYREIAWPMGPSTIAVDVPLTGDARLRPFAAGGELVYIPIVIESSQARLASSDATGASWSIAVKEDADVSVRMGFDLAQPHDSRKVARHDFAGGTDLLIIPGVGAAATFVVHLARPASGLEAWLDAGTPAGHPSLVVSLRPTS